MAETQALHLLLEAATAERRSLKILVDCKAVVDGVQALLRGEMYVPRFSFGWWIRIARCVGLVRHEVEWIPSHNKRNGWKAPWGEAPEALREINEKADGAAKLGKDMVKHYFGVEQREKAIHKAECWAHLRLTRQHTGALEVIASDAELSHRYERLVRPVGREGRC